MRAGGLSGSFDSISFFKDRFLCQSYPHLLIDFIRGVGIRHYRKLKRINYTLLMVIFKLLKINCFISILLNPVIVLDNVYYISELNFC